MGSTAKRPRSPLSDDVPNLLPIERVEDIPEFATEAEEADFWATHDTSAILDQLEDVTANPPWGPVPPRRTPGVRKRPPAGQMDLVSIRLPAEMVDAIKAVAARRHLPYQTLIRSWIGERLDAETAPQAPPATSAPTIDSQAR